MASFALVPLPASAASDLIDAVPEEVLGLAVVNRLDQIDAKLAKLAEPLRLPPVSLRDAVRAVSGVAEGWDMKGTVALVVMPPVGDSREPVPVLLLPVADDAKVAEQLGADDDSDGLIEATMANRKVLVGGHGHYAAIAEARHRETLKRLIGAKRSAVEKLAPLGDWLEEADAAVVILPDGLKRMTSEGRRALVKMREQMTEMGEQGKQAMAGLKVYELMFDGLDRDADVVGIGLTADPDRAVHITGRFQAKPGSKVVEGLEKIQAFEGDLLAGLPRGPFVFAAGFAMPKEAYDALMDFSIGMMKSMPELYGLSEEQLERFREIAPLSMRSVRSMSLVMGVGKPGDSIYGNTVGIMKVDDSKAFMADYEKYTKAYNKIVRGADSPILRPMKINRKEIGGIESLVLRMPIPALPSGEGSPEVDAMMKRMMATMFGPGDGLSIYIAPADEKTIVMSYTGQRMLRRALRALENPKMSLAADPDVAATTALLPTDAQWVFYMSPQGMLDMIRRVVPAVTPPKAKAPTLPEFPPTPPVGVTIKATATGLESHMAVPIAVLDAIAEVAEKGRGAGQEPPPPAVEEPAVEE